MMMTELDKALKDAFETEGEKANKAYAVLLRSHLFLPVKKIEHEEQDFIPLAIQEGEHFFIPMFDTLERLQAWASDHEIEYVHLPATQIIRAVAEKVYLCLNIGTAYYKEFLPDEILRLKKMVSKLDEFKAKGK